MRQGTLHGGGGSLLKLWRLCCWRIDEEDDGDVHVLLCLDITSTTWKHQGINGVKGLLRNATIGVVLIRVCSLIHFQPPTLFTTFQRKPPPRKNNFLLVLLLDHSFISFNSRKWAIESKDEPRRSRSRLPSAPVLGVSASSPVWARSSNETTLGWKPPSLADPDA